MVASLPVIVRPTKENNMSQPFNVNDAIKRAEDEYGLGKGDAFKVQEGDNVIRVLSPLLPHQSTFTDKQGKTSTSFKFVGWVMDRKDNVVKPYFMPMTIMNVIGDLQASKHYSFPGMPMPYDIIIKAKNAGKKEVEYSVLPVPEKIPLTGAEEQMLNERMSIDEYVEKLKEKQGEPTIQQEQPQAQQNEPGRDFARTVADGLPTGNPGPVRQTGSNPEPASGTPFDDIPFN
jgi:hypothetical protein